MTMADNIRGRNEPDAPDYARQEVDRLHDEYGELSRTTDTLIADAEKIPDEIPDDDVKSEVTSLIKRIRDCKVRIEGLHDLEKQPHLRRGQGVDQYFFGLWDKLLKRSRNNHDGIGDILAKRLTQYDSRKLAEEQERRRKAAEEAAKAEAIARAIREKAEREERERLEAAARARKAENIEAHTQAAEQAAEEASKARVEEQVATVKADEAHIQTLARPADIMRTRGADGTLSTMGTERYVEITDVRALDLEKLRPFIKYDALETALRGYAASVGYSEDNSVQIAGAKFGKRAKSVVR